MLWDHRWNGGTVKVSPASLARSSLVLWRMEPPPGRAWGCAPQTRSRSETCTTRKLLTAISRMLWDHQSYGGTVMGFSLTSRVVPCRARCLPRRSLAEPGPNRPNRPNCRNCPKSSRYFPGVSRSSLARPLSAGTAAGKSMGLCAPNPQQVKDLHHAEIAYRNFPYAVGPPMSRWNGGVFSCPLVSSFAVRTSLFHTGPSGISHPSPSPP